MITEPTITDPSLTEPRPPTQPIDGWEARYVGSEPRLSEVAELYRELGYEVRIEPYIPPADCGECKTCLESAGEGMRVVYVKVSE